MLRFGPSWTCVIGLLAILGCSDGGGGTPDGGQPVDQCLSPSDMELVASLQTDGGLMDGGSHTELGTILTSCARDACIDVILAGGDVYGCMDTCMQGTAAGAISPGCRGCYINNVICAQQNCVVPCLGSDPAACTACSNTYCLPAIEACLGYPVP